ncbi:methyltransferase FkbM family [Thiorhodococcus drewsii AZ1]|uniref:Methyltransferase FkbM family n=1 Tax=Thiorhodococcus drewsii AZ1 TaxID=765913 RepID=G2E5Y0_9GAMM|nr:FkbM family methyltransferase [Thiorhodococcus drewsii]EGV28543.1 methyltransferase FkbM family [Thiorhodococcus drewsii AZ1]
MRAAYVGYNKLLNNLKDLGFKPETVIDAGVANGTPWLYEEFPAAYFYLFEPVPSFEKRISEILKSIKGEHIQLALGSKEEIAEFYIPKDEGLHQISTFCFTEKTVPKDTKYEVGVTTLDSFFLNKEITYPILLKTDVQGYDLDVAKGAERLLKEIDIVITEVPVYGPWGGGAELKDYIDYYYAHDFILYDLVQPLRRPDDDRLHSIDLCFANAKLPLAARELYTSGKKAIRESLAYYKSISDKQKSKN